MYSCTCTSNVVKFYSDFDLFSYIYNIIGAHKLLIYMYHIFKMLYRDGYMYW